MDPQSPPPLTTVRRNPPRRAKQTPSTASALDFSTSSAATTIAPFPINEILTKPVKDESEPVNLKVFLRIRPLEIPKPTKNLKTKPSKLVRGKSVSEKNSRSGTNNLCLVANDSSSVTLTAPSSVLDKRSKSELYDGFSFVFPQDSVQEDVFEKAMCPLLKDFMGGRSALLAAMGPTGSGKTHTMFGTAREPGIVPLALRYIFNHEMKREDRHLSRSYYLSMFEIHSERGKGERIYDLSCDGDDLTFQQSTIKGLQETRISDANEAESLVARCLLKRATASTNANSQSSRSQCIINIRCAVQDHEKILSLHSPVLTIADLAGAEKERKTGNQGARLLESNFINNTSMVFGLCLRSLLEHQRNPKKSFEKHFKNSLLTRYLKEYLEGKKRMTLILTVKPGELDYLDTSFLLRQASPYMKIKFNNVEEVPILHRQKRNTTSLLIGEDHKRRKVNGCEAEVVNLVKIDANIPSGLIKDELLDDDVQNVKCIPSKSLKASDVEEKFNSELQVELATVRRNDEVMRKFSRALWNVLKQYKNKLEKSENEVQCLKEALDKEKHEVSKLEDELKEIRSCCSCYKTSTDQICATKLAPSIITPMSGVDLNDGDKNKAIELLCRGSPRGADNLEVVALSCQKVDSVVSAEVAMNHSFEKDEILQELNHKPEDVKEIVDGPKEPSSNNSLIGVSSFPSVDCFDSQNDVDSDMPRKRDSDKKLIEKEECFQELKCKAEDLEEAANGLKSPVNESFIGIPYSPSVHFNVSDEVEADIIIPKNETDKEESTQKMEETVDILKEYSENESLVVHQSKCQKEVKADNGVPRERESDKKVPRDNSSELEESQIEGDKENNRFQISPHSENTVIAPSAKSIKAAKPRRKLLPASTLLLKEFSSIDMEVENAKENRSKPSLVTKERSQGSVSLVRLLISKK